MNAPGQNTTRSAAGFTLIELMIVVAIIAILAAISLPSYNAHILRGKRAEGRNAVIDLAAREERYFSDNNRYTDALANLKYTDPASCTMGGVQTETCKYTMSAAISGANDGEFLITATPLFDDPECDDLTITHTGDKDQTGTGDERDCWGR